MKKLFMRIGSGAALSVVLAQTASAAVDNAPNVDNPLNTGSLGGVLGDIIQAFLFFAGAVAVLFLIIGGFRYVVSTGNPDQIDAARKTILYAVLGLIIVFIAFVLTRLVLTALNVGTGPGGQSFF